MDIKNCYLCNSVKFVNRAGSVRDKLELDILECVSCGLVFLSSFDHIEYDYYKNSNMHGEELLDPQTWIDDTAEDDKRRFLYLKSLLKNSKLLDYGCGAGGFLLNAKEVSAIVNGIELENRLSKHYLKHELSVFKSLSEIPMDLLEGGYDIITLFHVLEHIPDPISLLNDLTKVLADKGQIIIEVPNADDALLTLYKNESFSNYTYWSCHLFLFSVNTLKMLAQQAGLKVNYIKQVQRYPLSNHLYWLANGKPGGQTIWNFFDSQELNHLYEEKLGELGKCDTIFASFSKE